MPVEIQAEILEYLIDEFKVAATCLGLSCKQFHALYRRRLPNGVPLTTFDRFEHNGVDEVAVLQKMLVAWFPRTLVLRSVGSGSWKYVSRSNMAWRLQKLRVNVGLWDTFKAKHSKLERRLVFKMSNDHYILGVRAKKEIEAADDPTAVPIHLRGFLVDARPSQW